jgi:hypothetical protein
MSDNTYIKFLASQSNTDISKWDMKAFGRLRDKNKINKKFFELKAKQESEANKPEKVLIPKVKLSSKKANKIPIKMELTIKKNIAKADKLAEELKKLQEAIVKDRKTLLKIKKDPGSSIEAQLAEIVKQGFWEKPLICGNWLYLNTKNDVVICQHNDNSESNDKVNLGKYAVAIKLDTFEIRLLPYENNLLNDGYGIHPYCEDGHSPCWGTAYATVNKLKNELNLVKLMTLFSALLTTYSDENPMFSLEYFTDKYDYEGSFEGWVDEYSTEEAAENGFMHPDLAKKYLKSRNQPLDTI